MKNYEWGSGRHLKVHVSQIANAGNIGDGKDGKKGWNEVFGEMLSNQVKPFLTGIFALWWMIFLTSRQEGF